MPTQERAFERASEELTAAILPIVLERMRRAARQLRECAERLEVRPNGPDAASIGELEEVQRQSDEIGWLLGVLAAASGDDVPMHRSEPFGLAIVVDLVAEALAAEGERALEPDATRLPDLAMPPDEQWRLVWAVGLLFHATGSDVPHGGSVRWSLEDFGDRALLYFTGAPPASATEALAGVEALLDEARAWREPEGFGLEFPRAWIARRAEAERAP